MITKESTSQQIELAGKPNKPFDIFGFVFRFGPIILAGGLFLLVMFIPIVLKVSKPNFETSARLKIAPVRTALMTRAISTEITGYYDEYVNTQAQRIHSHALLTKAFNRLSREEQNSLLPPALSLNARISILKNLLLVYPVGGTHFVELAISGPDKTGLAPILNSVMDVYMQKMRDEMEQKNRLRLNYLKDTKEQLTQKVNRQEKQLKEISLKVHSSTFSEDFNIWQKKLVEMLNSSVNIFSERMKAENEYKQHQKASKELTTISLHPLIEESVMNDRAIGFTSSWTYQELQKMRGTIDGVTVDNLDRKRVEQRMKAMRDYEKRLRKETRDTLSDIHYGKRKLRLNQELIIKEYRFNQAKRNEEELEKEINQLIEMSGKNSAMLLQARSLELDIKHDRDKLFRIDNRIYELETESKAPLRVTIETRARTPESPAGSNIKKLLTACVALAFGSIGGLFLVIEFFDNRIRGPKNIIHALGHPPSWPISRAPDGVDFGCVLNRAPTSACSKAIRSLANKLLREHEDHGSQVFLFTGVDQGNGTTSILVNTSKALAYYTPKILVIDGHLPTSYSPENGQDFNHSEVNDINTLDIERFFMDAVKHDAKTGIDLLTSFFPNRPDSYNSRLFREILSIAKKEYDFICVDSGPVLLDDFTEHIAVNADVAVLIILGDSTLYRDLRRTAEVLIRLEIPAMAPVLNWGGIKKKPWFEKYLDNAPAILKGLRYRPPGLKKKKEKNRKDKNTSNKT